MASGEEVAYVGTIELEVANNSARKDGSFQHQVLHRVRETGSLGQNLRHTIAGKLGAM